MKLYVKSKSGDWLMVGESIPGDKREHREACLVEAWQRRRMWFPACPPNPESIWLHDGASDPKGAWAGMTKPIEARAKKYAASADLVW